jgi:hypothetical protein
MTDIEFVDDNGNCAGGGVLGKQNLAIMWNITQCNSEDTYKMIAHEIGHTLGLEEAFMENKLQINSGGNFKFPEIGFSRHNYMDYSTQYKTLVRNMFFRLQLERMRKLR